MWARVFPNLNLNQSARINVGGAYAFVLRKRSPLLMAEVNEFVRLHAQGSTFGNSLINRYVKDRGFVKNALGVDERRRYGQVVALFRKYASQYDIDYLLMIA